MWIINPPYGIGDEDWDNEAWGYDKFNELFKKISAIDQRSMIFVFCFGTIPILADFKKAANVFFIINL